jgi:hypothetical protein
MQFISENIIDQSIQKYEDASVLEQDVKQLREVNPVLMGFISSDRLDLLKPEELYLLEFIVLVVYSSVKNVLGHDPKIIGKELESFEEVNWETWNQNIVKSPKTAFDAFFNEYPQEDLLAFVEDSVQQDEESPMTNVGLELIAVTAKSVIDALHKLN